MRNITYRSILLIKFERPVKTRERDEVRPGGCGWLESCNRCGISPTLSTHPSFSLSSVTPRSLPPSTCAVPSFYLFQDCSSLAPNLTCKLPHPIGVKQSVGMRSHAPGAPDERGPLSNRSVSFRLFEFHNRLSLSGGTWAQRKIIRIALFLQRGLSAPLAAESDRKSCKLKARPPGEESKHGGGHRCAGRYCLARVT